MFVWRALGYALCLSLFMHAAQGETLVEVRAEAVDELGQVVTEVPLDSDFRLRIYVRDLRDETEIKSFEGEDLFGVFSAFMTTQFDTTRVSSSGQPTVDPFYALLAMAHVGADHVTGGGVSVSVEPAGQERLLYTAPFHAQSLGWATFSLVPLVESPNEWLLYGTNGSPLAEAEIRSLELQLAIVPEPSAGLLAAIGLAGLLARGFSRQKR